MKIVNRVIVVRAVIRFGDKFLLIEQMNASGNDYLLFPGGHVNLDESLLVALHREIREELNISDLNIKELRFVKETVSPFDINFEFFFECETSMKYEDIEIIQKEYTGYEKIKKCVLKSDAELMFNSSFYPEDFFKPLKYQLLELNLNQYKKRFGEDRNIKSLAK